MSGSGDALRCAACARTYPVHAGIPLMTEHPEAALAFGRRVVVENPYSGKWLDLIRAAGDRWVLDLGSGNNPSACEHVVKLDVFALPNVDVVGIAENLPFRDGVFRAVLSGAVFEHVMDPFALRWILESWADKLPLDARRDFLGATVGEVIREYKTDLFSKRWMDGLAAQDLAELACGVNFHGRKQARQAPSDSAHPPPEFCATPMTLAARAHEWRRGLQRRIRRVAARLLG